MEYVSEKGVMDQLWIPLSHLQAEVRNPAQSMITKLEVINRKPEINIRRDVNFLRAIAGGSLKGLLRTAQVNGEKCSSWRCVNRDLLDRYHGDCEAVRLKCNPAL